MTENNIHHVNKITWSSGPWNEEPDFFEWQHCSLSCIIARSHNSGGLCGYVGIPKKHLFYGKTMYGNTGHDLAQLEAHGGITFAEKSVKLSPNQPDIWWIGFDTTHDGDYSPGFDKFFKLPIGGTYRTFEYVQQQTERLAEQLNRINYD